MGIKYKLIQLYENQPSRMVFWLLALLLFLLLRFVHVPWIKIQHEKAEELAQLSSTLRTSESLKSSTETLKGLLQEYDSALKAYDSNVYEGDVASLKIEVSKEFEKFAQRNDIQIKRASWKSSVEINSELGIDGVVYELSLRLEASKLLELLSFIEGHEPLWLYHSYRVIRRSTRGDIELELGVMVAVREEAVV
ncbi:MAG: hypothetical protein HWE10_07260 [Gammaproteobacteria bacterium]|nr:hypothetical protein [Gammaproteobacteria bacterium]